jgi:hypothetical protein
MKIGGTMDTVCRLNNHMCVGCDPWEIFSIVCVCLFAHCYIMALFAHYWRKSVNLLFFSNLYACHSGNFSVYFLYSHQVIYVVIQQLYVILPWIWSIFTIWSVWLCGVFAHLTTSSLIERISISPWAVYILIRTWHCKGGPHVQHLTKWYKCMSGWKGGTNLSTRVSK